jgi:hypothetical protein
MTLRKPSLSDLIHYLPPWLMFIYPLLQFYSHNIKELTFSVLYRPFWVCTLTTLAAWLLLQLFPKTRPRASLIITVSWFYFFSHGHITTTLFPDNVPTSAEVIYLSLYLITLFLLVRARTPMPALHKIVITMLTLLMLLPLYRTVVFFWQEPVIAADDKEMENFPPELQRVLDQPVDAQSPDIYYLIFDRYGSSITLRHFFGFSNDDFEQKLKSSGFYIAQKSMANYPATFLSLASSLNTRYLDDLARFKRSSNKTLAHRLIHKAMIPRFLKKKGYRYIHVGSWWEATQTSLYADRVFRYDALSILPSLDLTEFEVKLLHTSWAALPIQFLLARQNKTERVDRYSTEVQKARNQIKSLLDTTYERGPKFVFCHFLLTHPPYYHKADGSVNPRGRSEVIDNPDLYLDSIRFANRQILKMVEEIDKGSSRPPVIVIQADEGPYSTLIKPDERWKSQHTRLRFRAQILNAIRIPGQDPSHLRPDLSPVNTFRLILNTLFKAQMPLLPDRVFFSPSPDDLYRFKDVTQDLLRNLAHFESHPMVDDWSAR